AALAGAVAAPADSRGDRHRSGLGSLALCSAGLAPAGGVRAVSDDPARAGGGCARGVADCPYHGAGQCARGAGARHSESAGPARGASAPCPRCHRQRPGSGRTACAGRCSAPTVSGTGTRRMIMTRTVECPTCKSPVTWDESFPQRPSVLPSCCLMDLGAWAAEEHVLPSDELEQDVFSDHVLKQ